MKKFLRHRGFTLIELLVVVGIISVLATIVIASLQSSKEVAQVAKTKNDVAQIKLALQQYYQDYGGYPACFPNSSTFPQACCIGGITCQAGAIEVSGALTELTSLLNRSHETQYAVNPTQLMASAYYRNKLENPVVYNCSAGDSTSGKELCGGTVSITYFTIRNSVKTVTTETLSDPGVPVNGVCTDRSYEGSWTDPPSATCGRIIACQDPLSNQYKTGDPCSTFIACTDPTYVENWDGSGRACFYKVRCNDSAYYEYHTASDCSNLIPTGGGGGGIGGCMTSGDANYNPNATYDDGSCAGYSGGGGGGIGGCTDYNYSNYNPSATYDDGSCM